MPKYFKQQMIETRTYTVEYIVEATNAEDAKRALAVGDTVSETEIRCDGVINRDPWEALVEMPEGWSPDGIPETPTGKKALLVAVYKLAVKHRNGNIFVNIIDLVKALRELSNIGLMESKMLVDANPGNVYVKLNGDTTKGEPAMYYGLMKKGKK